MSAPAPDHQQARTQPPPSGGFERDVRLSLLTKAWSAGLESHRDQLLATIAARSPDADRYRAAIVRAAATLLESVLTGSADTATWNEIITSEYPNWYHEAGLPPSTAHQRISRACKDVQEVLRRVVIRDEL